MLHWSLRAPLCVVIAAAIAGCAASGDGSSASEPGVVHDATPTHTASVASSTATDLLDADARLARLRERAAHPTLDDLPHLVEALGDPDFRLRRDAAGAIAVLGPDAAAAVPHLADALDDEFAFVRQRAAWALTRIGDEAALDALRAWARDIDPDELDHAMDALGTLGDARSVDLVAEWMTSDDPWIRRSAARALVRIGDPSAPAARALLDHEDADVACAAARVLGYVGDAATDLERLAVDPRHLDQVALCRLGSRARFGDPDAVGQLVDVARSADSEPAEVAVDSLAMAGSPAALNRLIDLLPHFERDDRPGNPAERALVAIGDRARAALAVRVVDIDGGSPRLQARVLAVIGDHRDLRALRQAADSAQSGADRRALEDAIAAIEARTPDRP